MSSSCSRKLAHWFSTLGADDAKEIDSMRSDATTVDEYLASLPDDRRKAISEVREVILANLPDGYEEAMNWGMITYQVPLETYPDTYNEQPSDVRRARLAEEPHGGVPDRGLHVGR